MQNVRVMENTFVTIWKQNNSIAIISQSLQYQKTQQYKLTYSNMKEGSLQETEDNFKVAPIISDQKFDELKKKVASTLIGLSILGHYQFNGIPQDRIQKIRILAVVIYLLCPALIVIPNSVISSWSLHALAVLIPAILCPILSIIADIAIQRPKLIHKYLITAGYSYLWAVHFYIARQLLQSALIDSPSYAGILILSIISVMTSCSTIAFSPVRQFSSSTFDYQQLNPHSTLYARFYVVMLLLLTQMGIYYNQAASLNHPALPVIQTVVALCFVTWTMGWLSSFYNNVMFIVNNLFNSLIFGEQVLHSGNNYRGHNTWWVSFLLFWLNVTAIAANILMVRVMQISGFQSSQIVQNQHILLVCLAALTSLIAALVVYTSYRCNSNKAQLIRFNKFNLTQFQGYRGANDQQSAQSKGRVYKGRCFFGHKQALMTVATLLVPLIVCLLGMVAFYKFYDAYGNGKSYQKSTNFVAEKIVTWILLLVNIVPYLFFVIFKEITRTRSKLGCAINPCCFNQFYSQVERDLFMKMSLKVTGALAVMALVLRMQNLQLFSWYIMKRTPISPQPHPYVQFFISHILIPILIYRSYKRSQNFSHFFNITIIVAFILTLIDSTLYLYESILVVLAMPNFPQNPFRLLLITPFTVPQKLIHKNQCKYRIGYLLVNFFTFFVYLATLGTMEFTMIFGLPMYWCIVPSINCQSLKQKSHPIKTENETDLKITMSDLQNTNQNLTLNNQVNSATPEHNLYQKIVSELPFYIFRNKRPGYYLLRISKYILLVKVIADFYGIFQTVSLIGLQTQQVTTCHAKEGETIDRIVEYTWGDNPFNHEKCACQDNIKTVIHEQHCVRKVKFTSQNEIQLTGIIQSAQFYELFKKCLIKSIIFNYNKMLKKNKNNQLTSQQAKDAEVLLDDLYARTNKQKIDEIYPYQFMTVKNGLLFQAKYRQLSTSKILVRKKLPPLGKKDQKMKKQNIIDDFADLIGASNTSDIIKQSSIVEAKPEKVDVDRVEEQQLPKQNNVISDSDKKQASDLHMAVIISAYLAVLGKINYINPEKLYKIMKKDGSALSQFDFQGGLELTSNSVGCALKIAIGKQLEAEDQIQYQDFVEYEKNEYLGTLQSIGFQQAISQSKQDIWTVSYNVPKRVLSVKRLAKNETPLYMFSFQNSAVQAIWNNLRFELLFATNDNDERYSIQTHQYLLRNLIVEGCEEPYGYAGYYSEQFLNL